MTFQFFVFVFILFYNGKKNRQKYDQTLPDGWTYIIQNRPDMFSIEHNMTNMTIVYKVQPISTPSNQQCSNAVEKIADAVDNNGNGCVDWNEQCELTSSKLPWNDVNWTVEITRVASTVDIWGRISDSKDWVRHFHLSLIHRFCIEKSLLNACDFI